MLDMDYSQSGINTLEYKKHPECQPTLDLLGIERGRVNEQRALRICSNLFTEDKRFHRLSKLKLSKPSSKVDLFGLDIIFRVGPVLTGLQIKSSGFEYFHFYEVHKDRTFIPCVVVNKNLTDADVRSALIVALQRAVKRRHRINDSLQNFIRSRRSKK